MDLVQRLNIVECGVNKIEQVVVTLDFEFDLSAAALYLTSPSGSVSRILRRRHFSFYGRARFTFRSVHFWGENPENTWMITIKDETKAKTSMYRLAFLHRLKILFSAKVYYSFLNKTIIMMVDGSVPVVYNP